MAKKQEQANEIVENEPVVVNEKDIVSGEELKETDVIDVNAPEVTIEAEDKEEKEAKAKAEAEEKTKAEEEAKKAEEEAKAKAESEAKANNKKDDTVRLKVLIAFTDKYTKQDYAINDEIDFAEDRAKELLADSRRLVEKLD